MAERKPLRSRGQQKIDFQSFFCSVEPSLMPSFSLPPINDNPDGGWGPSSSNLPEKFKFKDIPYAPYSKSDKLGRFADWNDLSGDNRQTSVGLPSAQTIRGGGPGGRGRRDNQAFGSGTASAFAYFHVEDESTFSLVDNKAAPPRRGGAFTRGRGNTRGGAYNNPRGAQRGGRGFPARGQRGGARRGWRDWDKVSVCPIRSSVRAI
jgi:translation initiation factor 3 subunit D